MQRNTVAQIVNLRRSLIAKPQVSSLSYSYVPSVSCPFKSQFAAGRYGGPGPRAREPQSTGEGNNTLDSFRDGFFWWRQIDQPRVVSVSALAAAHETRSPADAAFISTVPYTV